MNKDAKVSLVSSIVLGCMLVVFLVGRDWFTFGFWLLHVVVLSSLFPVSILAFFLNFRRGKEEGERRK